MSDQVPFVEPFTPVAPASFADVSPSLQAVLAQSEAWWRSMPLDTFHAPLGKGWSPSEHVRHLTTSIRAVTRGLTLPRFVVRLLFGRATATRTYAALRTDYWQVLDAGGQAGRFAPTRRAAETDLESARDRVLAAHAEAVHAMTQAVAAWDAGAVERYRLPHPLLGRISVLEMLYFMVYHNQHHVRVVARRLAGLPPRG